MGSTLPPACRGRRRPRRSRGSAVAPAAGFVGRQDELAILSERFSEAARGRPQVVYLEGEAGSGKSTLLSRFLGSLSDAVVLQAGGDEDESLLSYGVVDQLDPDAVTARAARRQSSRSPLAGLYDLSAAVWGCVQEDPLARRLAMWTGQSPDRRRRQSVMSDSCQHRCR